MSSSLQDASLPHGPRCRPSDVAGDELGCGCRDRLGRHGLPGNKHVKTDSTANKKKRALTGSEMPKRRTPLTTRLSLSILQLHATAGVSWVPLGAKTVSGSAEGALRGGGGCKSRTEFHRTASRYLGACPHCLLAEKGPKKLKRD